MNINDFKEFRAKVEFDRENRPFSNVLHYDAESNMKVVMDFRRILMYPSEIEETKSVNFDTLEEEDIDYPDWASKVPKLDKMKLVKLSTHYLQYNSYILTKEDRIISFNQNYLKQISDFYYNQDYIGFAYREHEYESPCLFIGRKSSILLMPLRITQKHDSVIEHNEEFPSYLNKINKKEVTDE